MKTKLFEDSIVKASGRLMAACLPFLTLGMLGEKTSLIAAAIVAAILLLVFAGRIVSLIAGKTAISNHLLENKVSEILAFPYAIALSGAIATQAGIEADYMLWFGAALALLMLLTPSRQKK